MAGFDNAMSKVKFRMEHEEWDLLKVAEPSSQNEDKALQKKLELSTRNQNVKFSDIRK